MPYQPPVPLLVPTSMPPVPPEVVGLDLKNLGLMTPEEELSNQQLEFSVSFNIQLCVHMLVPCGEDRSNC